MKLFTSDNKMIPAKYKFNFDLPDHVGRDGGINHFQSFSTISVLTVSLFIYDYWAVSAAGVSRKKKGITVTDQYKYNYILTSVVLVAE